MNWIFKGCTKLQNEIETQRTKRNETKRNILKCETKRNETKYTKMPKKFVSDLGQVGGFLRFPPPVKLTATILVK
jgi:hypothetical protein